MKKYILTIILILLAGCADTLPKWYLVPKNDNSNYIYATGAGKSKREAVNNALNNAVSKIQITISSNFNMEKKLIQTGNNTQTYQNISQIIKTNIPKVKIYDYKIIKIKKENRYYILLSINRIKNANLIYQHAKNLFKEIKNASLNNDKIYIIKKYPSLIEKLNQIISNLYFAYTLYPEKQIKLLLQQSITLKNKMEEKLQNTGFYIISDYRNILHNVISSLNLPIKYSGIKILQNHSVSKSSVMGYYIETINMSITLKDKSSISFSVICSGKSISGYSLANSFAVKECKNKIREKLKEILHTDSSF